MTKSVQYFLRLGSSLKCVPVTSLFFTVIGFQIVTIMCSFHDQECAVFSKIRLKLKVTVFHCYWILNCYHYVYLNFWSYLISFEKA